MKLNVKGLSVYSHGDSSKLTIVFVHGFPYSASMWRNQVEALEDNFHCVSFDLRGLGNSSPGDGQMTIEGYVDDLCDVMDELKIEKAVIAGFSMGGYITLRAMEKVPERFRGLILCDTKSAADDDAGKIKRAELIKSINLHGIENFASSFVPITFAPGAEQAIPEVYQAALNLAKQQDPLGVKGCLLAMAARTDTTQSLDKIKVPTLLIVGEQDGITPPEVMRGMQQKITGSEIRVIKNAGHMSPLENPTAVTEHIQDFLKKA